MSWTLGRFSDAPYAAQRLLSIVSGGEARKERWEDRDRERDRLRGAPGICVEGGGVMSEDEIGGGEYKVALSWLVIGRRSGEGDRVGRRAGVLGTAISAGGAREV